MPKDSSIVLSGQCACGSIRYECGAEPAFSLICQCRQCQRITGTGHSAQFAVDKESTQIKGDPNYFEMTSDAGNEVTSAFCGNCGSPVFKTTAMMPRFIVFHAATLDEPSRFKPEMVVYSEAGQLWDHIDSALPRKE